MNELLGTPWSVGFGCRILTKYGRSIALCGGDGSSFSAEQNQKHAEFIASAPDMRQALQALSDALMSCGYELAALLGPNHSTCKEAQTALEQAKPFLEKETP